MMAPLSALCERSDYKLFHLNSSSHNGEIVQLQSALNDDSNNFQEKSNTCHISEPIIGRFFPNLVLVRSLRGSFIGCLPFTRNFGKFPLGISVGKSAFHLDTNLIRSQAPLCRPLEFPAKIQNGGSDVDAA